MKVKNKVLPSNTIYARKPLYALVKIEPSKAETSLDGLGRKLIPISLVKKQFSVGTKHLFGRLIVGGQGRKKVA